MDFTFLKEKNISIIGHDNPDTDSIISGILLGKLLNYLDIKASFVICDKYVDSATVSKLLKFGVDISIYMNNDLNDNLILVDHHHTKHNGNVVAIIDHHPTIKDIDCEAYLNKNSPSTTLHIYNLMLSYNYPISKEIVELVVLGAYTDTCSLQSSKVSPKDKLYIKNLISKYSLNEAMLCEEGLLLRDLKSMKFDLILTNGLKEYIFGDFTAKSSYLRVKSISDINFVKEDLIKAAKKETSQNNINSWVFVVVALQEGKTLEIRVFNDKVEQQIHESILSRGKDIIPKLEKKYCLL